jgi:hypothetical protein
MEKMKTLPEVLDSVGFVLVDGCVRIHGRQNGGLSQEIYDARFYSQIAPRDIQEDIDNMNRMIDLFGDERVSTIPEVAEEIEAYARVIGNKLASIGQTPKRRDKRIRGVSSKACRHREMGRKSERLLRTLQERIWDFYNVARSESINITMPCYDPLVDMIKIIDSSIGLRGNTDYVHGVSETKEVTNPRDTDERMIAASFCYSRSRDEPFAILTGDTGFVNLWGVGSRLLGAEDLLPHNEWFRELCSKDIFRLYVQRVDDGNYFSLPSEGMSVNYCPRFEIGGLDRGKNEEVKGQVLELMKKAKSHSA